jgi:predicted HTH domain antitoxin
MSKTDRILDQLLSWKNSYIAPSAAITMDEAAKLIQEQVNELNALTEELKEKNDQLEQYLKSKKRKVKNNDE